MGKGTKKKTIWRTLSIGDTAPTSTTNGSTKEIKKDYKTSFKIDVTSQPNNSRNGKLSSTSSELSNNENRNSFNTNNHYNYNKYNNNSSNTALPNTTSSSQSHQQQYNKTYLPYKRRPFSSKSVNYNNYYSNTNSSSAGGNYRSNYRYRINNSETSNNNDSSQINNSISSEKKESNFNEDEYTRITTPRQDVLFKKGYLSKPKKYLKYNDLHTPSSSGTMSVISTEESTTTSTQSVTPENFNSIPENPDESEFSLYPYQSFFDQNGLYYGNPYGFDPYGGQMFMMPYPTSANCQQPFNPNSFDIYDNSQITTTSTSPVSFNQNPDDNIDNLEDSTPATTTTSSTATELQVTMDTEKSADDVKEASEEINSNGGEIIDNEKSHDVTESSLKKDDVAAAEEEKDDEQAKAEENNENNVLGYTNVVNPSYYPFMYYPYYYCPPHSMFPVNDLSSYTNGFGIPYDNSLGNKYFKYKKRKRKLRKTLNSSGVTTDDCSEDDESTDNETHHYPHFYFPYSTTQTSESTKCYLNVEVEEFQPKCYTPKLVDVAEKASSIENIPSQTKHDDDNVHKSTLNSCGLSPEPACPKNTPFVPNYSNVLKMESKDINKKTASNNINLNNNSISNKVKKKHNKKSAPKSSPAANSSELKQITNHHNQTPPSNEPTYAQMLNGVKKIGNEITREIETKPIDIVKNETSTTINVMSPPKKIEKWQTVIKSKGKRGKNIQVDETDVAAEIVNEDVIQPQFEISHDTITTNNDSIISVTSSEGDVASSLTPMKTSSAKQKSKNKSSKKNPRRKNLQTKHQNGFEVIEPTFTASSSSHEIEVEQQEQIDDISNNLIEFDSFIDEVQDVINGDVEIVVNVTNNEEDFVNYNFSESIELDKDFDIIEKNENNNHSKNEPEINANILDETNIEETVAKESCCTNEQDITVIDEKPIVIDLDEELKNGCAIENKINGQVEEIIEKITVNEIESICSKIEEELSIDDNHITDGKVATNVVSPNFDEKDKGDNSDIMCPKMKDLCDKNQEETEKIRLSNNVNENLVTVIKENICVKENMKFPLTEAVTKWLFEKENQKSAVTEPVLRLPADPILSSKIQLMILSRTQFYHDDDNTQDDDDDGWTTESETELEHDYKTKNFVSNPLPVSSHNSSNEDINNISVIDTDSDYMSDSRDDNTRKRVAATKKYNSDTNITTATTTTPTTLSSNNQSKLSSKSLDRCIKLPFTDVCCVLM